ncbi:hypothetical protein EDEG_01956 [Edhazardia aedis USNM 41457]|uniref:General transcription and DNA repair factor IIH subunit TFB5 n=1 Tax=Edhazardia aedis (strain USNM 41457) TaxID=1003232 RepID=J9D7J7_EDHAE|nr:hypothetical protein EDEG_01956 [Edhazardia aedis USNM 41457]|eukprot:EJW03761.1 hypothetical protein EDEG_01956 [Edhazardia aedis USNM 41457]
MVKLSRGSLLKTEPNIKELILRICEHAVIEDINDSTLFVKTEYIEDIKVQVYKIIANATKQLENEK